MRSDCNSSVLRRWSGLGITVFALFGVKVIEAAEPLEARIQEDVPFVCAQVVLAIDGSESTREDAFQRQITAFGAAFGSDRLYYAIQDCLPGSVAFAAITWSGADEQEVCLDWSVVTSRADGQRLAERFKRCKYFGGTTDIGRAVEYGLRLLESSPLASFYRAVLVLTNGRTDRGSEASLSAARAEAAATAVTLAAYALLRPQPKSLSPFFVPDAIPLEDYVAKHVSVGPRAFTAHSRPADDVETLLRALIELLRQEPT